MKTKTENLRNSYDYYRDQQTDKLQTIQVYLEIVHGFIKFMVNKILTGWDVHLSGGNSLGVIGIRGNKTKGYIGKDGEIKGLPISWGKTFKLWREDPEAKKERKVIYCFNEHSNGVRYKFVWFTQDMKLSNKTVYGFSRSRANKRMMNRLVNGGQEYQMTKRPKY